MSNKILDHIEHVILEGSRRAEPNGIKFDLRMQAAEVPSLNMNVQYKVRGELKVFFEQHISETASSEERLLARERAKVAIARHLYRDVLADLHQVQEFLWGEGISEGRVAKKIDDMILELSGQMTRFEP